MNTTRSRLLSRVCLFAIALAVCLPWSAHAHSRFLAPDVSLGWRLQIIEGYSYTAPCVGLSIPVIRMGQHRQIALLSNFDWSPLPDMPHRYDLAMLLTTKPRYPLNPIYWRLGGGVFTGYREERHVSSAPGVGITGEFSLGIRGIGSVWVSAGAARMNGKPEQHWEAGIRLSTDLVRLIRW